MCDERQGFDLFLVVGIRVGALVYNTKSKNSKIGTIMFFFIFELPYTSSGLRSRYICNGEKLK